MSISYKKKEAKPEDDANRKLNQPPQLSSLPWFQDLPVTPHESKTKTKKCAPH